MLAPGPQLCLRGALIGGSVVDASRTSAVTTLVIEHRLDHVRLDPDIGHASGDGSSDVVQAPRLHRAGEATIELRLAVSPGHKTTACPRTEQAITGVTRQPRALEAQVGPRADDLERCRWHCDRVGTVVLGALGRQRPDAGLEVVELAHAHPADLLAPGTEQDQQPDDAPEVVIATGFPDRHQLAVG